MDGLPEAAGPNASASPGACADAGAGAWLEPAGACADADAGADLGAHVAVRCVMTSVYALIVTVGLVGNVTLLRVLAGPGARRSVPGVFMCSLAAGDVLLLVTCVPADAARYFSEQWLLGGAACRLVPAVQMTSVGVSVFTLTALSADRYKAIVRPMELQSSRAVSWSVLKAAGIWLLSALLATPEAVFSQVVPVQASRGLNLTLLHCVPYPPGGGGRVHARLHALMLFLLYFLLPLGLICLYYYHIARTLTGGGRGGAGEAGGEGPGAFSPPPRQMETRRRLAKIVLVFVGLFAVCWLPNHLLYLYRSFRDQQPDLSLTHLLLTLTARPLSFCSSCLNPLALCLLSHSFRQHFSRRLRCVRGPRPERQASYLHSTSHIRLTSVRKGPAAITAPAAIMAAPVANGNADEQEVVL